MTLFWALHFRFLKFNTPTRERKGRGKKETKRKSKDKTVDNGERFQYTHDMFIRNTSHLNDRVRHTEMSCQERVHTKA